jgi:leader peptidase (prepilin peptidase)/N-methyltransferase
MLFASVFSTANGFQSAAIGCIFCSLLLLIAFIDMDTMEIYDAMVIGGMLCGIVLSIIFPSWQGEKLSLQAASDSVIGVCFGSGLALWIAMLGEMVFKREAIGGGDLKLMGMVGSFIGCKGSAFAIFGGCFIATAVAVPVILIFKLCARRKIKIPREVPFAPFIAVGGIAYVLFGHRFLAMLF